MLGEVRKYQDALKVGMYMLTPGLIMSLLTIAALVVT
jgi:hypothetical protein